MIPPIAVFAAQWLTRGCSSEDEESQDGDGDVPMDGNIPGGRTNPAAKKSGDLTEYNLDTYDEDDTNEAELGPFTNVKGLTYYRNNDEDPYITFKGVSVSVIPQSSDFLPIFLSTGERRWGRARRTRDSTYRQSRNSRENTRRNLPTRDLCLRRIPREPLRSPRFDAAEFPPMP